MAPIWVFGIVGIFLVIGLVITGAGAVNLRRWRTMKRLNPVGSMAAEEGLQEFEGTAHAIDGTVTAPFTEAESLVCKHKVERYSPNSDNDGSNWSTMEVETRSVPFEIEHSGSTVAVDSQDAQHLLTQEFELDTDDTEDIPEAIATYMQEEHDIEDLDSSVDIGPVEFDKHRKRFSEERLDEGENVYALGPVQQDPSVVPDGADSRMAINPVNRGWKDRLLGAPFVVSDSGEQEAIRRQYDRGRTMTLVGLLFAGFSAFALGALMLG